MAVLQSALAFVVAIGVLVTVHEFGHFWVARKLGVKVLRFSVGFGRPLISRRWGRDRTEYVLALVPLGGYVKMLDEREGDVPPAEQPRAFNRQSLAVRCAIVVAGPLANFLFAVAAYWLMFVIGVSGLRPMVGEVTPDSIAERAGLKQGQLVVRASEQPVRTWEAVVQRVITEALSGVSVPLEMEDPERGLVSGRLDLGLLTLDDLTEGQFFSAIGVAPARPAIPPVVGHLEPGAPAARSGLQPGDRVISANREPIPDWSRWVEFVRSHPEQDIVLEVQRGGAAVTLNLRPAAVESEGGEVIGRIGAGPDRVEEHLDRYYVIERYGGWESLTRALDKTRDIAVLTLNVFWKMIRLEVSVRNLSGPISIAQYAGYSAEVGVSRFLEFLALVSVSLGILNLLPIPVLDGGHLLYYLLEAIKGGPLSEQTQAVGQQLGIALLVGLMSLAFYNDIARLLG